ncbi:MAG: hypothetical protein K2W80_11350 [Burkholderiales bacterium]|nr:hypothetical protein [Burkholderiales bacterium]
MNSKNKPAPTAGERRHIERVKALDCVVCGVSGPSEAHEIKQGSWFLSCALCADCHRGSRNGIHGEKRMWLVTKMTELDALNETLRRLYA